MKYKRDTTATPIVEIPYTTWIVCALGVRHIVAKLFPLASRHFDNYTELFGTYWYLISDALVLLIVIAYTQRLPEAGNITRAIWRHGRLILGAAFLLDIAVSGVNNLEVLTNPSSHQFGLLLTTIIIDIAIVLYLLTSKSMEKVFNSFPEPKQQKKPPKLFPIETERPRSNIPVETLLRKEIVPGYVYADYPFLYADTSEPILRIRKHIENKRMATAEKGLRFLIESQPNNSLYWHELAMVALAKNKLEQAEALILKAMLLEANNFTYIRNLGEVRRRLGFFVEAIKYANLAIKIAPEDTTAKYNLGIALWDQGEKDQALEVFEKLKSDLTCVQLFESTGERKTHLSR